MTTSPLPLTGVRTVALEQYIAGPYCSGILAALGAEVVKVENPRTGGDPRRHYEPVRSGLSSGFVSYNRGKQSVALDLDDEGDAERLHGLLAGADVFVSNLRPGALARQGLDWPAMHTKYPRLIMCEISGFGTTGGPYGDWPAFDSVIQAMSGLSSALSPRGDGRPALAPMSTTDIQSGTWAALGILAALLQRQSTSRGVHVDAAMYDIAVASLERPLSLLEFGVSGNIAGADAQSAVGTFRALGGWVALVIPTNEMWLRCCRAIGRTDLLDDARLQSLSGRAQHMDSVIVPALESWAIENRLDEFEAAARLRESGQPAGPVQNIEQVRRCAQLEHRSFFEPLEAGAHPASDPQVSLARFPLLFDGEPLSSGPVPALDENSLT